MAESCLNCLDHKAECCMSFGRLSCHHEFLEQRWFRHGWLRFRRSIQTCHGPNAASHRVTGKPVTRSLHGHYLVESALFSLLLESCLSPSASGNEPLLNCDDISEIQRVYHAIFNSDASIDEENLPVSIQKLNEAILTRKW